MSIKFKKLHHAAMLPRRGTEDSAGLDLYALRESAPYGKINTGIAVKIPPGHVGLVKHRSSSRFIVRLGAIDADYRGELFVQLEGPRPDNHADLFVRAGERIAQLIVMPCNMEDPTWSDELDETERGDGGFGSTGQ